MNATIKEKSNFTALKLQKQWLNYTNNLIKFVKSLAYYIEYKKENSIKKLTKYNTLKHLKNEKNQ